eukprot:8332263-Karenia_brevis.AAC.1
MEPLLDGVRRLLAALEHVQLPWDGAPEAEGVMHAAAELEAFMSITSQDAEQGRSPDMLERPVHDK